MYPHRVFHNLIGNGNCFIMRPGERWSIAIWTCFSRWRFVNGENIKRNRPTGRYYDAQVKPLPPHDDPPELPPKLPKRDIFFSVSIDAQEGQGGDVSAFSDTSSSNSFPHSLQLYS